MSLDAAMRLATSHAAGARSQLDGTCVPCSYTLVERSAEQRSCLRTTTAVSSNAWVSSSRERACARSVKSTAAVKLLAMWVNSVFFLFSVGGGALGRLVGGLLRGNSASPRPSKPPPPSPCSPPSRGGASPQPSSRPLPEGHRRKLTPQEDRLRCCDGTTRSVKTYSACRTVTEPDCVAGRCRSNPEIYTIAAAAELLSERRYQRAPRRLSPAIAASRSICASLPVRVAWMRNGPSAWGSSSISRQRVMNNSS